MWGGSDTWTWNGTTWTKLSPSTKPPARSDAAAAFDPNSGNLIMFGGLSKTAKLGDTWRWNGTNWTQLSLTTSPAARADAGAAFDPITNQITLFGGLGASELNDTWAFNQTTWTQLSPAQSPSARDSFGFAPTGDGSLVLVNGKNSSGIATGTWVWQTAPSIPTAVTATAGNRQATVNWAAPLSGGAPITSYTVTASPGGATATSTQPSATVTGLAPSTSYTFTVTATNTVGTSPTSASSNQVTTPGYPSAPQNLAAASSDAQATLAWQAPASDGGASITGYAITTFIGSAQQSTTTVGATTLSTTITGLSNGTTYTFNVAAINVVGTGPSTTASTTPTNLPSAPLNVSASSTTPDTASVSWGTPLSNGGSPITGYVITPYQGSTALPAVNAAASPATVSGLTGSVTYTFSVAAVNANGTGPTVTTALITTAMVPCPVSGATDVWTGAADGASWTTPGNWSAGQQPGAGDFACLPSGTLGTAAISVPQTTVQQLVSYKPLSILNGLTTTAGADFEAATEWGGGTLSGPNIVIGNQALVTVDGQITLGGAVAVTNTGHVTIVNGPFQGSPPSNITQPCGSGNTATWTNTGTLTFSDTASGSSLDLCSGTVANAASGVITRSVAGIDYLSAAQVSNAGAIITPTGSFNISSTAGQFTGGSVVGSPGKITLAGTFTASPGAVIGDNVWVSGTLGGTTTIPAGATVHVGYDPSTFSTPSGQAGTISGAVAGAGTLSVVGFSNGTSTAPATVAADLNNATVFLGDFVNMATKPDTTPSQIGSQTAVTVAGKITLTGTAAVQNAGTVTITVGSHIINSVFQIGGLAAASCSGAAGPSWANSGTLNISDTTNAAVSLCTLTNTGLVARTAASGQDNLSAQQLNNSGTITALGGTLFWNVPSGQLTGGVIGGGAGQLVMTSGTTTSQPTATVGDNVWVSGITSVLTGTIVIPASATVHVGYDAASPTNTNGVVGTISGTVAGSGTLSAVGHVFDNSPNGSAVSKANLAADLNVANVVLGDYAVVTAKADATPIVIGLNTNLTVAGFVPLTSTSSLTNNGTITITSGSHTLPNQSVSGGLSGFPCANSDASAINNTGSITLADPGGGALAPCASLANSGTITHTGSGTSNISAATLTNSGTISAAAGQLRWSTPNGQNQGSLGGGAGQLVMTSGTTTSQPTATVGDNVWVSGITSVLTGTIVIPASATVHVGYDAASPTNTNGVVGTISGTVAGSGTLSAVGHQFNNFPNPTTTATALVAADLNVATATLDQFTTLGIKPDTTPTSISPNTTVTLVVTPTLAPNLTLNNAGIIDFGTNGYFNCGSCTVINESGAKLRVNNPDGTYLHGFGIASGTFDNEGIIDVVGKLPGVGVWFGTNVAYRGAGKGQAMLDGLTQPAWMSQIKTAASAQQWATSLTQSVLNGLGVTQNLYNIASTATVGSARCTNVGTTGNIGNISVAGASFGACVIVDPTGAETMALSVAGGITGGVSWPASQSWALTNFFNQYPFTVDTGAMTLFRLNQGAPRSFNTSTDVEGMAMCANGTFSGAFAGVVGLTGQLCWGPSDGVPFNLDVGLEPTGVYSGYAGVVVGAPGVSVGVIPSYTVMISCAQWNQWTTQRCPLTNLTAPAISGTPAVGNVLSVSNGTWTTATGDSALTYSYKWQRCTTSSPGSCGLITGATSSTYTVTTADRNDWISAIVTASSESASSQAVATPVGSVP